MRIIKEGPFGSVHFKGVVIRAGLWIVRRLLLLQGVIEVEPGYWVERR